MKKWRNSIVPKEVICDGTSTEACAAEVCEELDNKGYLGTLDFSLCYDHIDPKIIVEVLKKWDSQKIWQHCWKTYGHK